MKSNGKKNKEVKGKSQTIYMIIGQIEGLHIYIRRRRKRRRRVKLSFRKRSVDVAFVSNTYEPIRVLVAFVSNTESYHICLMKEFFKIL